MRKIRHDVFSGLSEIGLLTFSLAAIQTKLLIKAEIEAE